MKFISLFTKAPNYKRFSYEPRYYDAKAEERKEREERIKRELELERGQTSTEEASDYRKRMTGAFHSARRRSQASPSTLQSSLIRFGVLLFLALFIMAFLTWGKIALYGFLLFVPVYIYLKFKK
jgi:Flp pilus assembly protein TadB